MYFKYRFRFKPVFIRHAKAYDKHDFILSIEVESNSTNSSGLIHLYIKATNIIV